MGQKVNPHGLRVGVIKDWDSRWFVRDEEFGDLIVEDDKIRKFIKKQIAQAGVPQIEIERDASLSTALVPVLSSVRAVRISKNFVSLLKS